MNIKDFLNIFLLTFFISGCASDRYDTNGPWLGGKTEVPFEIRVDASYKLVKIYKENGCPQVGGIAVNMVEKSPDFAYVSKRGTTVITQVITNGYAIEIWNVYACGERRYFKVTYNTADAGGIAIEPTKNTVPWWIWLDAH